jgi:hypothetical protein
MFVVVVVATIMSLPLLRHFVFLYLVRGRLFGFQSITDVETSAGLKYTKRSINSFLWISFVHKIILFKYFCFVLRSSCSEFITAASFIFGLTERTGLLNFARTWMSHKLNYTQIQYRRLGQWNVWQLSTGKRIVMKLAYYQTLANLDG